MVVKGKEWGTALLRLFHFDRGLYGEQIEGAVYYTGDARQSGSYKGEGR